jgi:hypothetical protein
LTCETILHGKTIHFYHKIEKEEGGLRSRRNNNVDKDFIFKKKLVCGVD